MPLDLTQLRHKTPAVAGTALFALFVVMLPRYTDTAKTWYVLLILLASGYMASNLRQLRKTSAAERLFLVAVVANFLWIAFCFYINGEPGRGASILWGRHFYALFMVPVFFMFKNIDIPETVFLVAACASIALSMGDILIDLAQGVDHRQQGMNPNGFGPIQLCLSAILLFFFIERPETRLRWLALAGAILGLVTVVFSLSRNTWMTLAILGPLFALYLFRSHSPWRRLGLAGVLLLLLCSSYLLPMVQDRIEHGFNSIENYFASDDYRDGSRLSSFGVRMELWKTGWYIFRENPLLGVGVGGFEPAARANSERYRVNPVVHQFKYVHNQYLAALATRGFPGLILFLMVMLLPVYIALSDKNPAPESRLLRLSLLFVCLTYLVGCFAEDHFEAKSATMFFGIVVPLLLAKISTGQPTAMDTDS